MVGPLQLVVVGNVPKGLLKELAQPIANTFKVQSVSGASLTHPQYALNPQRQQFHATAILRRLAAQLGTEQFGILGICDVDLFTPDAEFVFGEADRESRAALISIHRLKQGVPPEILLRRAQAEVVHEVGHLLGLSHCDDLHCAMFLSRSPADSDRKGTSLCNDCRHELARLTKVP
jgi:archaemetzincin